MHLLMSKCETNTVIFSHRTFLIGLRRRPISFTELTTNFPSFFRLNNVYLWYDYGLHPIEEKCGLVESHLSPLIPALNDAKMILIRAAINQEPNDFSDYSAFLDHIRNRLLPICDSARCYKFDIIFPSKANTAGNVISSILQMQPIKRCSNVEIEFIYYTACGTQNHLPAESELPVEAISYWLEKSNNDGIGINVRNQKEGKFLQVQMENENAVEMFDHLRMVRFIYF